jgi:hypothetical protein
MAGIMVLIVIASLGGAVFISGVGLSPFLVVDALILTLVIPPVLVMVGTPPRVFRGAFRIALQPEGALREELVSARAVLRGLGRVITLSVALYSTIALIAIIYNIEPGGVDRVYSIGRGVATVIAHVLYALLLQAVVVQPLVIRVERVLY